jgi:N-acetylglucosaminyl-diphospho-decaprenol L-rhamnosyltransferase
VPAPASPPRGEFAIVTVTHNSAAHLPGLLESAARYLPGVRTVVVDCASRDDTVAVAGAFADAVVVALGENAGFGRANNRGLAEVSEPVAVLLNPDVEVLDDSMRALAAQAALAPDRLLAPLVLYPDGTRQDTVHPPPASAADLVRTLIPGAALAALSGRAAQWLEPWRSPVPCAVGWAVGCAIAARTDTLRRLGPFDEAIFLYGEDMELGLRAAAAGVPTWFWPAARVCHHRAHASAVAFGGEPFARLAAARHDVVGARLGARRAAIDDVLQALTFGSRIAVKSALRRSTLRERAQLRALRDVRRGGRGRAGGAGGAGS